MTRTESVMAAVAEELGGLRAYLDGTEAIRSVTIVVLLVPGTTQVRAIIVRPETERALTRRPPLV